MRITIVIVAVLFLGGCKLVVTPTPMFTRADEAGAPALKPGLWRFDNAANCVVDESKPLIDWPRCAGGVVLKAGEAGYYERATGAPVWTTQPVILAAGTPRIAQVQVTLSGAQANSVRPFAYGGVRPTAFDAAGAVTAFALWPVLCGPPAAASAGAAPPAALPPGLTDDPDGRACRAASAAAVRGAASASEAWSRRLTAHWVRSGAGS